MLTKEIVIELIKSAFLWLFWCDSGLWGWLAGGGTQGSLGSLLSSAWQELVPASTYLSERNSELLPSRYFVACHLRGKCLMLRFPSLLFTDLGRCERWMGVFSIDWEIVFRNFILTTGSVFFGSWTFPQEVRVWQHEKVKLFKLFLPRFVRTSLIRNNPPNLLRYSPLFKNSTRQLWWWRRSYQDEAAYITLHCKPC